MGLKMSRADADKLAAEAYLRGGTVSGPASAPEAESDRMAFRLSVAAYAPSSARWSVLIERWHPTTLNRLMGCHHMEAARLKALDARMVGTYCLQAGVPAAVKVRRRVSLAITLGKGQRGPDKDCWWKSTLDALVRCGALHDDSDRWCELGSIVYLKADERATRITLEDVPPLDPIPAAECQR